MNLPDWLKSARTQTSLLLLSSLFTVLSASMIFINLTLEQRFAQLEARETTKHIERVAEIISNELGFLGKRIGDWGDWDDAADYFQTKSRKFEEANLEESVLESMNLSSIRFYKNDGSFQGGIERQPAYEHPELKQIIDKHLPDHPEVWPDLDNFTFKSGILNLGESYFIYATKNVRPTNRQGPSMGRLIFMRLLDKDFPQLISTLSKLSITMTASKDIDQSHAQVGRSVKLPTLLAIDRASYEPTSLDLTWAYIWAYDSNRKPVLRFDFFLPRELLAQGRTTLRTILIAFGISILITLIVQTWGMQKILLQKLIRLRNEVSLLAITVPEKRKVSVDAQTEVRDLAIKINEMLEEIQARQIFVEQQNTQIHELQLNQALLQERETSEKSLRMASELRFHLAGLVAHRLNNPINFIQLSLMNSREITSNLEVLFRNLFSEASDQDPEVLACRQEFDRLFSQLQEHFSTMEKGLKRSAESIVEIRLFSGVDGPKVAVFSASEIAQVLKDLVEELTMDQWSKRLIFEDEQASNWQIHADKNILKTAIEILLTVCLQNSHGLVRCSLKGDNAKDWYVLVENHFEWENNAISALERNLNHILETCEGKVALSFQSDSVKAHFSFFAS